MEGGRTGLMYYICIIKLLQILLLPFPPPFEVILQVLSIGSKVPPTQEESSMPFCASVHWEWGKLRREHTLPVMPAQSLGEIERFTLSWEDKKNMQVSNELLTHL